MCGITGYWDSAGAKPEVAKKMAIAIKHRGPDDCGIWLNNNKDLALAHRRLSIIDLSPAGHQPMLSKDNRFVLVYNGEIYNHLLLRTELIKSNLSYTWRGSSDTETLLMAIVHWGVKKALKKINGMFAFALWDNHTQQLTLARDRIGEKTLYYGIVNNCFLFASELRALKVHPKWQGIVDRDVLALYMRHNYVPTPYSIYKNIKKLAPAHFVTITNKGLNITDAKCYWNLYDTYQRPVSINLDDATNKLEYILNNSVKMRMMADVPIGAFLSGGIDSSMITALMQANSFNKIKTFTIGFYEKNYNEANYAKEVAQYLGTEHNEIYVSEQEAMAVIPKLATIWDEPFADSSQIPTLLLSQLTKKHVSVSLSGDGGDEIFCGYNRYISGYKIWQILQILPLPARKLLAKLLQVMPGVKIEAILNIFPKKLQVPHLADRLPKLAYLMQQTSSINYYKDLVSHFKNPTELVLNAKNIPTIFDEIVTHNFTDFRQQMMYIDSKTYLADDILTKVDRATMAVSLESRAPFLDHNIIEFTNSLPLNFKYHKGVGKYLLRKVLYKYVPKKMIERPKMGFGVPIDNWLRTDLRDWAEYLLDNNKLKNEGFLNHKLVQKLWQEHLTGKRHHYLLWDILMFEEWLANE